MAVEKLEHPVTHVRHIPWEERVRSWHPEELAFLVLSARRCSCCLAEHEVRGGLRPVQPRHARHDVLVPVQDQQELRGGDLVAWPWVNVAERPGRAAVLGVRGVEEI